MVKLYMVRLYPGENGHEVLRPVWAICYRPPGYKVLGSKWGPAGSLDVYFGKVS